MAPNILTIITALIPFLFFIPIILLIRWMVTLKKVNQKQVEQNKEIIELLKELNEKENDKFRF